MLPRNREIEKTFCAADNGNREVNDMSEDIFGGFGGLMRGLSGLMPQDDPNVKLLNLQSRLDELKNEEMSVYADAGKSAISEDPGRFREHAEKLSQIRKNIAAAESELAAARQNMQKAEEEEKRSEEMRTCPQCGFCNPEGVKFCQECGTKLGPHVCRACGAQLTPGTKFCGSCGARQEDD